MLHLGFITPTIKQKKLTSVNFLKKTRKIQESD